MRSEPNVDVLCWRAGLVAVRRDWKRATAAGLHGQTLPAVNPIL